MAFRIKTIVIVVYMAALFSCDNPAGTGENGGGSGDPESRNGGARWFLREFRQIGGREELRYLYAEERDEETFLCWIENYEDRDSGGYYDFLSRFYFLVRMDGANPDWGEVVGIKTGRYDSYLVPGEEGFSVLTGEMGFDELTMAVNFAENSLDLDLGGGDTPVLGRIYSHRSEWDEEREHDGALRNGVLSESFDYYPMGGSFRLSFRVYFAYTREDGARVTLSRQYNIYGSRAYDGEEDFYRCRINGFSNNAYSRYFYEDGHSLYEQNLSSLGFDTFREIRNGQDLSLQGESAEGEDLAWDFAPAPYL